MGSGSGHFGQSYTKNYPGISEEKNGGGGGACSGEGGGQVGVDREERKKAQKRELP